MTREDVDQIRACLIYYMHSILLFKEYAFVISVRNEAFSTKTWTSKKFVESWIYFDCYKFVFGQGLYIAIFVVH